MTALTAPAVAALGVAALGLVALSLHLAARAFLAATALKGRARRAVMARQPQLLEAPGSTSLAREPAQRSGSAARLAGLLAPGEQSVPGPRLLQFALLALVLALLLVRAGLALFAAPLPALVLAATVFHWQRWREATAVARAFEAQLPDAIGLMVRCVRAGVPFAEAVHEAGAEMAAPAGPLFAAADRQIRLGRQLEDALWDMARVVGVAEFRFLCVAVAVQRETGGNLAETLSGLEATVRKRLALRLKVRALTSEARASALIIGALPLLMAAGLAIIAPDYLEPLFATGPGRLLLATAIGSLLIGGGIMTHLVRRETGPA